MTRQWPMLARVAMLVCLVAAVCLGGAAVLDRGLGIRATGVVGAGPPPRAAGDPSGYTLYLVDHHQLVRVDLPGEPHFPIGVLGKLFHKPAHDDQGWPHGDSSALTGLVLDHARMTGDVLDVTVDVPANAKPTSLGFGQLVCTGMAKSGVGRVVVHGQLAGGTTTTHGATCVQVTESLARLGPKGPSGGRVSRWSPAATSVR